MDVQSQPASTIPQPGMSLPVLTNQLYIEFPTDWSLLLQRYSVWRYRLSDSQGYYSRNIGKKYFYERFTNAYKNQFDQPFYYFTFDRPQATLYTFLPNGHQPEPWLFSFGKSTEEITGECVAPDELRPHVLLKLMTALCFFETNHKDRTQRVCQSKFFLRVKGKAESKTLTAVEVKPSVVDEGDGHLMTLTVEAGWFGKVRSDQDKAYIDTGTYYEQFESQGQTYLRQIRPSLVADFTGDLYQPMTIKGKKAQANWHTDAASYKESRSYLVRHVQERLIRFMSTYGFRVVAAEERMFRQPTLDVSLPLQRFPVIQVLDNRLNRNTISFEHYLVWLGRYHFPTSDGLISLLFHEVGLSDVDASKPLLVLLDAEADAFGQDESGSIRLLTEQGIEDPYRVLYRQLPNVIKQSLNVNPNAVEKYAVAADYLTYPLPESTLRPKTDAYRAATPEEKQMADLAKSLNRNLEVCLSELWLKWVSAGQVTCTPAATCLPYLSQLSNEWGFMTDNLLLYLDNEAIQFADLATPEGKRLLKERFTAQSQIRKHYMERTQYSEERTDTNLPKAHFVLIGQEVIEIDCTAVMAMPNWPVIKAIKADDAAKSARSREAIGVYAGGIWYNEETHRYIVSGTESSAGKEERGHHIYQIHTYGEIDPAHLSTLLSLLTVTFVRKNRFTVWPYPFDLIRLRRELSARAQ